MARCGKCGEKFDTYLTLPPEDQTMCKSCDAFTDGEAETVRRIVEEVTLYRNYVGEELGGGEVAKHLDFVIRLIERGEWKK
jgi:hypothetical protein